MSRPFRELLMMRTKGFAGPVFHKGLLGSRLMRGPGAFIASRGVVMLWRAGDDLPDGAVFSRASVAYARDVSGAFQQHAIDVPRFDGVLGGALLIEPALTNDLNNTNVGAAIGTYPTRWKQEKGDGAMDLSVVGLGASEPELGLPYIDFRMSGTPSIPNKTHNLVPNGFLYSPATTGDRRTVSVYTKLVAGTIMQGSAIRMSMHEARSTTSTIPGGYVTPDWGPVPTEWERLSFSHQMVLPDTTNLKVFVEYLLGDFAAPIDMTLRFVDIQLEPQLADGDPPTSPILAGLSLVTRQADVLDLSGVSGYQPGKVAALLGADGSWLRVPDWDGVVPVGAWQAITIEP